LQIDIRVLSVKGHLSAKSDLRIHEWYCIHARMAMRVTSSRVTYVRHACRKFTRSILLVEPHVSSSYLKV